MQYVARRIMLINELQKFKKPEELADNPRLLEEQDDEIFNKARLVNCGYVSLTKSRQRRSR